MSPSTFTSASSRRRWLLGRTNSSSNEYACLGDDEDILKRTYTQRKTKRLLNSSKSQHHQPHILGSTVDINPPPRRQTQPFDPFGCWTESLDEERLDGASGGRDEERDESTSWYELRFNPSNESDEDGGSAERMMYAAKHFDDTASPRQQPKKKKTKKPCGGALPRLNCGRSLKAALQKDPSINTSKSFETQETQPEEASETTSVSTALSTNDEPNEDGQQSPLSQKRIQWVDEVTQDSLLTVHSFEHGLHTTCRIVILLLMNNGPDNRSDKNFEFLHCEYQQDERLKISDALKQITELVGCSASDRPFTALCYESREMINAFALQDYGLVDGQAILVAIRQGSQDRDILIKQSAMLLADKQLRREIRKARISGRSLQILHSTEKLRESERNKAATEEKQQEADRDDNDTVERETKETDTSAEEVSDEEGLLDSFSFGNFSHLSIHDDDFDAMGFYDEDDMGDDSLTSSIPSWLDDDFFKGNDFFLHDDVKATAATLSSTR